VENKHNFSALIATTGSVLTEFFENNWNRDNGWTVKTSVRNGKRYSCPCP
jgi:hypothetical protein